MLLILLLRFIKQLYSCKRHLQESSAFRSSPSSESNPSPQLLQTSSSSLELLSVRLLSVSLLKFLTKFILLKKIVSLLVPLDKDKFTMQNCCAAAKLSFVEYRNASCMTNKIS